ncbi:MAG: hypothetical protein SX243_02120 [Acidobacteriota bacterium]|nr:hypothetical protein [Acidobacteriota bacterium]
MSLLFFHERLRGVCRRPVAPATVLPVTVLPATVLPMLLLVVLALGAGLASPAMAQGTAAGEMDTSPLTLYAHKLENQSAMEAMPLVYPLLSDRGTVELKPKENTLVVRDQSTNVRRIVSVLEAYDHPRRPVAVEIQLVRATAEVFSPTQLSRLPDPLLERLQDLLPYHSYELLAGTRLNSREGESVRYRLSSRYGVEFRIGTMMEGKRLRLHGFQLSGREKSQRALIHTNLNLHLNQTLYLGLAASESSGEALMVVITARRGEEPPVTRTAVPDIGRAAPNSAERP